MQIYQLIYQSTPTVALTASHLMHLLPTWRARNHAASISGLLLYGEESIMQVLEGPANQVHQTYQRIARDLRHYNVSTIADGPVLARAFGQWSMGFAQFEAPDFNRLAGYVSLTQTPHLLPAQPELLALLQEFVAREQYPIIGQNNSVGT